MKKSILLRILAGFLCSPVILAIAFIAIPISVILGIASLIVSAIEYTFTGYWDWL